MADNPFMDPKKPFYAFQDHDADINIKPFSKKHPGVYEIHEGSYLPGKAIWKVNSVYDNGIELISVESQKVKFISYENIAIIHSEHHFFSDDEIDENTPE